MTSSSDSPSSTLSTLPQWLNYLEQLHPAEIELGLERVREVADRLAVREFACPVVLVAGTNGKGSTLAYLEALLQAAGQKVGLYTSPHLLHFNERVRIDGEPVSDEELIQAFQQVDAARKDTSLTYFEFTTLAALLIFQQAQLDAVLLEVGLGGRLDATNIVEPDVCVITRVALDHQQWLGSDRETIGREKAGIMRTGKPVICADPNPPQSVVDQAGNLSAPIQFWQQDFYLESKAGNWTGKVAKPQQGCAIEIGPFTKLALPAPSAAAALQVMQWLQLDLQPATQRQVIETTTLAGRLQLLPGKVTTILDVAHNADAAQLLAQNLGALETPGKRLFAVFGAMQDKDLNGLIEPLLPLVDIWLPCNLGIPRAASADSLAAVITGLGGDCRDPCESPIKAYRNANELAKPGDQILVFGSFYTLAELLPELNSRELNSREPDS